MQKFSISFNDLMSNFTLVTDWEATLPCIFGASSSSNAVQFSPKWVGCVVHKLNTLMKHTMQQESAEKSRIASDLDRVKEIVRMFKKGGWNADLPDGLLLFKSVRRDLVRRMR